MASALTSCAPCVFGAAQSALLSYTLDVVGSLDVLLVTSTVTFRNGSTSTTVERSTLGGASGQTSFLVGPPGTQSTVEPVILSDPTPTWEVSGTTLTYPTTYVQYLAFQGAAVTPPATACAQNLPPSSLSLPASTTAASFIYPQDNITALPAGLLGYLDTDGGIPAQLAGDELSECAPLSVVVTAVSGSSSTTTSLTEVSSSATAVTRSSVVTATSVLTSTETSTGETTITTTTTPAAPASSSSSSVVTTVVEPTTLTSVTAIEVTTEQIVATTQTLSQRPALVLNTIEGRTVVPEDSTTVTPLGVSLADSSSTSSTVATVTSTAKSTEILSSTGGSSVAPISSQDLNTTITTGMVTTTTILTTVTPPGSSLPLASPLVPISLNSSLPVGPGSYGNGNSTAAPGSPSGTVSGNPTGTDSPFPYTGAASSQKRMPALGGLIGLLAAVVNF